MFKQLSTALLQHLIAQNNWAMPMLKPHAGKSAELNGILFKTGLVILENGSLAAAGESRSPDAVITIPPSVLPRLLAKDEAAKQQIKIEGDTGLATALARVFSEMRWDYEDDISKLIGDVAAHRTGTLLQNTANTFKASLINLAEMLTEYWQEETPMLAKKRHVEQFNSEVDQLRADTERLQKRIEKLAATSGLSSPSNVTNSEK